MSFLKDVADAAKKMPKVAWVAAAILPGGLTAVGFYLAIKGISKKKEVKNDQS